MRTLEMKPEKILYEAEVTATGGRDGKASSSDGLLSVSLSLPKALGGPGGQGTNPEQLFAAGYALEVELRVSLPGVEKSLAEEIVAGAHERCPYSNATRDNVDVTLTVV